MKTGLNVAVIAIAIVALCFGATASAQVIARHADLEVHAEDLSGVCSGLSAVKFVANSPDRFTPANDQDLAYALAATRTALQFECDSAPSALAITGYVGEALHFSAVASDAENWKLVRSSAVASKPKKKKPNSELVWKPKSYPSGCHTNAKDYLNLPALGLDEGYMSANEPEVSYTMRYSRAGHPVAPLNNAAQSGTALMRYASLMQQSYADAASAYWQAFDQTGNAPSAALRNEYTYWIIRRDEHAEDVSLATSFAGELTSIMSGMMTMGFGEPEEIAYGFLGSNAGRYDAYIIAVRNYDYRNYSSCTLASTDDIDEAIEYTYLKAANPKQFEGVQSRVSALNLGSFSEDEKTELWAELNSQLSAKGSIEVYDEATAKAALEARSKGAFGVRSLKAFVKSELDRQNYFDGNAFAQISTYISAPTAAPAGMPVDSDYRGSVARYMLARTAYQSWPAGFDQKQWVKDSRISPHFQAMPIGDVPECAVGRINEAIDYLASELPNAVERAALQADKGSLMMRYCLPSPGGARVANFAVYTNSERKRAICLHEDAYRIAMLSCASGGPMGAPQWATAGILGMYTRYEPIESNGPAPQRTRTMPTRQ